MGRRLLFFLLFSAALVQACRQEAKAELLIPDDQLVDVLVDVHLAEAALQNRFGLAKDTLAERYYDKIFELHGIEQATFDETMERVRRDPEIAQRIYERVLEKLSAMEAEIR